MIERNAYIKQLAAYIDTPFIKVLSGIRRSGKSGILELLREHLVKAGKPEESLIYINFEVWEEERLNSAAARRHIKALIGDMQRVYLLLDEVQLLPGWERVVNAFFAEGKCDIYITGSNSKLLSSELSTLLSGRTVQFTVRTLSFSEFIDFTNGFSTEDEKQKSSPGIWDYIRRGGFPGIHYLKNADDTLVYKTVQDIFAAVVLKDVLERNNLRNPDLLERVTRFLLDNTGSLISARSISNYFKSQNRSISVETILDYIAALEAAYAVEKVRRYDVQGKSILNVREKYYPADISFIHALLGFDTRRLPGVMETLVFHELRRRGYEVFTGQLGDKEIDFVATKDSEKIYIQTTYLINNDAEIIKREFGNLLAIPDQYPKLVLSLDEHWKGTVEGVRHQHLGEWLHRG
ncbi:MAG: ATP-binding protein [Spirochaetaceae bacterium]|jgi:predicted AAA+ superfamily ATPase|nr:ATP-binding protein [Spirochaetaceae bacterium]